MGKPTGFMEYRREVPQRRPALERLEDWRDVYNAFAEEKVQTQGARCMDCGI
ncbi:MAG: glutamate synthase, partial [Bacteroidota bacterium]